MSKSLPDVRSLRYDQLRAEAMRLADLDEVTPAEDARLDEVIAEAQRRQAKLDGDELAKWQERARTWDEIKQREGVELIPAVAPNPFQHMRRVDPDAIPGDAAEARDIALASVDRLAEQRSDATPRDDLRPLFDRSPVFSQFFSATGSPTYARAFTKLIAAGDPGQAMLAMSDEERHAMARVADIEQRAANLTGANGGFAVPQLLDPSVMLSNRGAVNPMRSVARIVTGVGDTWEGVASEGITANWYNEAAEVSDDAPTLAQPKITAHRASAFVPTSIELLQDWQTMEAEIGRLFFDAKDRLEADAFINGNGTGKPRGLVNRLEAHTGTTSPVIITSTTAGTFDAAQVRGLFAALPPRFRPNASWLSSISVANFVRGLGDDKLQNQTVNLSADYAFGLLGRPYYEASEMDELVSGTTAATLLVVGDFSNYLIFDRMASARVELVPHLFGSNRRPTGQRGLFFYWRTGGDVFTASNTAETGFRALANKTS